jgi:hypothetical protein
VKRYLIIIDPRLKNVNFPQYVKLFRKCQDKYEAYAIGKAVAEARGYENKYSQVIVTTITDQKFTNGGHQMKTVKVSYK